MRMIMMIMVHDDDDDDDDVRGPGYTTNYMLKEMGPVIKQRKTEKTSSTSWGQGLNQISTPRRTTNLSSFPPLYQYK